MKTWNPGNGGFNARGNWKFPGSPVVRTQCFHCHDPRFDSWSGNYNPESHRYYPPKRKLNSETSQGHGGGGSSRQQLRERTECLREENEMKGSLTDFICGR